MSRYMLMMMKPGPERDKLAQQLGYEIIPPDPNLNSNISAESIKKIKTTKINKKTEKIKGDINNKLKSEQQIEKEICYYLFKKRIEHWNTKIKGEIQAVGNNKFIMKQSANKGFPDILCCIDGLFVGVEVKKPGGVLSEHQLAMKKRILCANGYYFVVTSVQELEEYLFRNNLIEG